MLLSLNATPITGRITEIIPTRPGRQEDALEFSSLFLDRVNARQFFAWVIEEMIYCTGRNQSFEVISAALELVVDIDGDGITDLADAIKAKFQDGKLK